MRLLFCTLLLFCGLSWSCDRENFDESTSTSETFDPIVTELPYYTWALGIDTLPVPLDSSWIGGALEEDLKIFIGIPLIDSSSPAPVSESYFMEFRAVPGWPIPEDTYDLERLTQERLQFNPSTGVWDTLLYQTWAGNQIEGEVEFIETELRLDTYWNLEFWEYSGFASGVLTNDDGTTHQLSSAFHRLR